MLDDKSWVEHKKSRAIHGVRTMVTDHALRFDFIEKPTPSHGISDDEAKKLLLKTLVYRCHPDDKQKDWILDLLSMAYAEADCKHGFKLGMPTWFYCPPQSPELPDHHTYGWYATKPESKIKVQNDQAI